MKYVSENSPKSEVSYNLKDIRDHVIETPIWLDIGMGRAACIIYKIFILKVLCLYTLSWSTSKCYFTQLLQLLFHTIATAVISHNCHSCCFTQLP